MGLLEPWHLIVLTITLTILVLFPVWGYRAGSKRTIGGAGGLMLGLFFNIIGIIIVYCTPIIPQQQLSNRLAADELQKYKQLLNAGAITEAEYEAQKAKLLNS